VKDTPTMKEARELIAFYDARGSNWECALAFTLLRRLFGGKGIAYNPATHFLMPIRKGHRP